MPVQRILAIASLLFLFILQYGHTLTACRKDDTTWFCLESDTCGDMYGSCSDDILLKPKNSIFDSPWIKAVIVIKLCVAIGLCYYYLQVYRRRRAIQTVIDQNTQQVMVHVVRGSSTNNASLNEQGQPPPTYQQATELKAVQN